MKYFLYARKSSEDEERQVLSIESQLAELKKKFGNLEIVDILQESASAFKPDNLPEFTQMLDRIENGEADISFSTLRRISKGLRMKMYVFVKRVEKQIE